MAYRIVAERGNETVRMDRSSSLMAVAKARVWASEGWEVTIIVRDQEVVWLPPSSNQAPDAGLRVIFRSRRR